MEDEVKNAQELFKKTFDSKKQEMLENEVKTLIGKETEGLAKKSDYEGLSKSIEELGEGNKKLAKAIEDMAVNQSNQYGSPEAKVKSQTSVLNDIVKKAMDDAVASRTMGVDENNALEHEYKKNNNRLAIPVIREKASLLASIGAGVIQSQRTPGIQQDPFPTFHFSEFLPQSTIGINSYSFVQEKNYDDQIKLANEGEAFVNSDFELQEIPDSVSKIMAGMSFTDEILRNVDGILGYILPTMGEYGKRFADSQAYFGTGTGIPKQMNGVFTKATPFVYNLAKHGKKVKAPNLIDLIAKAKLEATNIFHTPTAVIVNDADWTDVMLAKGSDAHYTFDGNILISDKLVLQVIQDTMMPRNKFMLGNFKPMACQLVTQLNPVIEFSPHPLFATHKILARYVAYQGTKIMQPNAFVKVNDIDAALISITEQ